jgi:hypothetical protein
MPFASNSPSAPANQILTAKEYHWTVLVDLVSLAGPVTATTLSDTSASTTANSGSSANEAGKTCVSKLSLVSAPAELRVSIQQKNPNGL